MNIYWRCGPLGSGVIALLLAALSAPARGRVCATTAPLSDDERNGLAKFVGEYFEAPYPLVLSRSDIRVRPDCVYELRFRPRDQQGNVELVLLMSPDRRFLGRDFIDRTISPTAARTLIQGALWSDVNSGVMPVFNGSCTSATTLVVVFGDFACPYVKQLSAWLKQDVKTNGKVRLGFRFLPIVSPASRHLADVAACAFQQGDDQFWRAYDVLFAHQADLVAGTAAPEQVLGTVAELNVSKLHACLATNAARSVVDRDIDIARRNGFSTTPIVVVNGRVLRGPSEATLRGILEEEAGK